MGFFSPDYRKLHRENDIEGLLHLLERRNPWIRLRAFSILAEKLGPEVLIEKTSFLLNDRNDMVKNRVAIRFCSLGHLQSFDLISSVMSRGSREEKIRALQALPGGTYTDPGPVITMLLRVLQEEKLIVQVEVLRALAFFRGPLVTERLRERLHDRHHQMRIEALKALAAAGDEADVDFITSAMVDPHAAVRREALSILDSFPGEAARQARENRKFIGLVRAMNENFSVRLKTVREIGEKMLIEGLPLLVKTSHDRYKSIRIESARSLGAFRDPGTVTILRSLLDDRYWDVRLQAALSLGKIKDQRALEALEYAEQDKNSNVRNQAKEGWVFLKKHFEDARSRGPKTGSPGSRDTI